MSRRTTRIAAGAAVVAVLALGGAGIARATGAFDEGERQLTGTAADRAGAAALRVTGGGTVLGVERDNEGAATYEVEVRTTDGSTVEVQLDDRFRHVGSETESGGDDGED